MSGVIYLHDGTLEGLLTAVARAVKSERQMQGIFGKADYVPNLFDTVEYVPASAAQAKKLLDYLAQLDPQASQLAINGYLSEDREVGIHLYHFVGLCLRQNKSAVTYHAHNSVRLLDEMSRKVSFEAHRLSGLIRFRILADELQYGPFSSDHNVIGFCAAHFRRRLASRRWILHDLGRNIGLYWDTKELHPVSLDEEISAYVTQHGELPATELTADELYYQRLWRGFYQAINNPGRENKQLQRQLMPRRYWKYLVESPG